MRADQPEGSSADAASDERDAARIAIASDLRQLGVPEASVLLVHASLRSMGFVPGGAATVVAGLLEAVGENGTLAMPALSYASVTSETPRFDVRSTPSCVGALPEYFRAGGATRSLHPTHSVCARGQYAGLLLEEHALDRTPVGEHSPFRRLEGLGGKILMLGCGLLPNTAMHGVEQIDPPPYLLRKEPIEYTVVDQQGVEHRAMYRRHDFGGWNQRYDRIATMLDERSMRFGRVHGAMCYLIDVPAMFTVARRALRDNPYAFVERSA